MTLVVASLLLGHSLRAVRVLYVCSVCSRFCSNSVHVEGSTCWSPGRARHSPLKGWLPGWLRSVMIHALGVRVQSQEVRVVVAGKASSRVRHIPRRKNNAFRRIQLSHLGDNSPDTSLGRPATRSLYFLSLFSVSPVTCSSWGLVILTFSAGK